MQEICNFVPIAKAAYDKPQSVTSIDFSPIPMMPGENSAILAITLE
jgi:hypothetical protein